MNPCNGCENRYIGCHDQCEEHALWKEEKERIRAEKFKGYSVDTYTIEAIRKSVLRGGRHTKNR